MRIAVTSGILFLSGIGALIFETLWLRVSGLVFGNSVWSAALILSSFMAGLALGNAIAASARVQPWRPLRLYAALEVGVAIFGCAVVFSLPLVGDWLRPIWQTLWNYQPAVISLRFVLSFLILLVPTSAMGLTLPVLVEDPLLRRADFGRVIGFLYGFNTLGAVVGALLGEVCLVKAFGVRGTSLAAGMASCIAAVIALLLANRGGESGAAAPRSKFPLRLDANYRPPWRLLLVSFGAGCLFLALEVVWFRFLRLYVASSATAFAVMLAVALAGIGSGSIVAGAIQRRGMRTANLLPVLLLLGALATLGSYLFFPANAIPAQAGLFEIRWTQIARVSIALMFPASFLSGILLPSIIARVHASVKDRMNSAGVTTLFNTIGAALGPLLATFLLLPRVGYQWSLIFCAAGYALLAIVATERQQWSLKNAVGLTSAGLTILLIVAFAFFPYHRAEEHFAHASRPYEVDEQGRVLARVVKKIEGTSDTLQLLERDLFGEPYYYRLLTNAFSMSATNPHSQRYMRLFAYLPLAFRGGPKDVLLICYGCGVTADAFLRAESVRRLDAVDISKEIFALADFYSGINYSNPLRDSRAAAIVQDGRFFLQACPRQYDIISGEPPPPKVAGSVNLYTEEFFSLMKGRLKDGGIATFWLPLNQLKLEEAKAILRAFRAAFPTCSVWAAADQEWIMMGVKGAAAKVETDQITRLWTDPKTGADLRRIGMEVPEQLGALFIMDGEEIDRITDEVAPLIDNYPKRLTDERWDAEANQRFALSCFEPRAVLARFQRSSLASTIWPEILNRPLESLFALRQSRYLSEVAGSNTLEELDLYLRHSRLRTPILEVLGSDGFRLGIAERVARKSDSPPVETLPDLIAGALAAHDVTRAIDLLEMQRARSSATANDLLLLIYLYCLDERLDKAEALANANASLLGKASSVEWLWHKLQADFGFHPPP